MSYESKHFPPHFPGCPGCRLVIRAELTNSVSRMTSSALSKQKKGVGFLRRLFGSCPLSGLRQNEDAYCDNGATVAAQTKPPPLGWKRTTPSSIEQKERTPVTLLVSGLALAA